MSYVKTNFPSVLGITSNVSTQELLILTNQQRQSNSLYPLTESSILDQAAVGKASDMFSKNYWAHIAPDGTTPWVFIKGAGYNYIYAGENLARGYNSAQDVVNAWMASPEHRQNMLSSHYQNVGFAVATGSLTGEDTVLVVEMLGSTSLAQAPIENNSNSPTTVAVASGSPSVVSKATPPPIVAAKLNSPSKQTQLAASSPLPQAQTLINSSTFSSFSAKAIVSFFILILVLDMVIIERRKIVRFVGHNLDHVLFLSLILIVILILFKGWVI